MFNKKYNLKKQLGGTIPQDISGIFIAKNTLATNDVKINDTLVYLGENNALRLIDNQIILINKDEYNLTKPPVGLYVKFTDVEPNKVLILESTSENVKIRYRDNSENTININYPNNMVQFKALLCPGINYQVILKNLSETDNLYKNKLAEVINIDYNKPDGKTCEVELIKPDGLISRKWVTPYNTIQNTCPPPGSIVFISGKEGKHIILRNKPNKCIPVPLSYFESLPNPESINLEQFYISEPNDIILIDFYKDDWKFKYDEKVTIIEGENSGKKGKIEELLPTTIGFSQEGGNKYKVIIESISTVVILPETSIQSGGDETPDTGLLGDYVDPEGTTVRHLGVKPSKGDYPVVDGNGSSIRNYYCDLLNYQYENYFKKVVEPIRNRRNKFPKRTIFRPIKVHGESSSRNCIIQVLFKTPIIAEYLYNLDLYVNINNEKINNDTSIMNFLHKLCKKYYDGESDLIDYSDGKTEGEIPIFKSCPHIIYKKKNYPEMAYHKDILSSWQYISSILLKSTEEIPLFSKDDLYSLPFTKSILKNHLDPFSSEVAFLHNYLNKDEKIVDDYNITFNPPEEFAGERFGEKRFGDSCYISPLLSLFNYSIESREDIINKNDKSILSSQIRNTFDYLKGSFLNINYNNKSVSNGLNEILSKNEPPIGHYQSENAEDKLRKIQNNYLLKTYYDGLIYKMKDGEDPEMIDSDNECEGRILKSIDDNKSDNTSITNKIIHMGPLLVLRVKSKNYSPSGFDTENKIKLEIDNNIYINNEKYLVYAIIYRLGQTGEKSVCCIRDLSKENTWYFLNNENDNNNPIMIEGRVPEIYREKVELLFYCKESIKDEGYDPADKPLPSIPPSQSAAQPAAQPATPPGGDAF